MMTSVSLKLKLKLRMSNSIFQNKSIAYRHGFTLIELLVVIAIIALLVSILLPSLQTAKELAKNVLCASNMRQIGLGICQYESDHDGQRPIWGYWWETGHYYYDDLGYYNDYLPNPRMYDSNRERCLGTIWKCSSPPSMGISIQRSDYGMNYYLPSDTQEVGTPLSETFMLSDMRGILVIRQFGVNSGQIDISPGGFPCFRHMGKAGFLFMDIHFEQRSEDYVCDSVEDTSSGEYNNFWGTSSSS